jgi:hypothetical protein
LYTGLIRVAGERDALFRNCLCKGEKEAFERALTKLAGQARALIEEERALK